MSTKMEFRQDINGLRGVSIVLVLLFHADESLAPSGFIGVDIFFVISGYLITRKLIQSDASSAIDFYAGRIKRIWPAFFGMLVLSDVTSRYFHFPPERIVFVKRGRCALLMVSNLCYYKDMKKYFVADPTFDLLTHTWSLSVEEQFYLFYPLVFMVWRKLQRNATKWVFISLLFMMSIFSMRSFYFRYMLSEVKAFYLPQYRAWQLLCGCAIAVVGHAFGQSPPTSSYIRKFINWIELAIFALTLIFVVSSPRTNDVYHNVLKPFLAVFAGTLAICSYEDSPLRKLLSITALSYVGNLSYSLYLYHWPVITFLKAFTFLTTLQRYCLTASLCFLLSEISFRCIESPIRTLECSNRKTVLAFFVSIILMLIILNIRSPYPQEHCPFNAVSNNSHEWNNISAQQLAMCVLDHQQNSGNYRFKYKETFQPDAAQHEHYDVLLTGDSHARQLWPGLERRLKTANLSGALISGANCDILTPKNPAWSARRFGCDKLRKNVESWIKQQKPGLIIFAERWHDRITESAWQDSSWISGLCASTNGSDFSVAVIMMVPIYDNWVPPLMAHSIPFIGVQQKYFLKPRSDYFTGDKQVKNRFKIMFEQKQCNVKVFDVLQHFCHSTLEVCQVTNMTDSLYQDDSHLSLQGSYFIDHVFKEVILWSQFPVPIH